MLGSYNIIPAVFSYFFKVEIPMCLFIVDVIFFLLLDIYFVIIKIKKPERSLDIPFK